MMDLGLVDDGTEEDLGPRTAGEELFDEYVQEGIEGIVEDRPTPIKLTGTSAGAVFAALLYLLVEKVATLSPFVAMGANPFLGAKLLTRALFTALAAIMINSRVPRPLFQLLRAFGPVGKGAISGTIDRARRTTLKYLDAWSKMPNPEASMRPALEVVRGFIKFDMDKMSRKALGAPSTPALLGGSNADANTSTTPAGLPGTGPNVYFRRFLDIKEGATTDEAAKQVVRDVRLALDGYAAAHPEDAKDLFAAQGRGIGPSNEVVFNILLLPMTDMVESGEKDANGLEILIPVREERMKALVRELRKQLAEARLADGTAKPPETQTSKKGPNIPFGAETISLFGRDVPHPLRAGLDAATEAGKELLNLNPAAKAMEEKRLRTLRERELMEEEDLSVSERFRNLVLEFVEFIRDLWLKFTGRK